MAKTNKRFYWIQLNQEFFNSKEMKLIRKIAGGSTYTIIYLKLMLLSLEDDGKIYYDGLAKSLAEELSLVIDEKAEDIEIALNFLENKELMTRMSDTEFFLEQVPEMTGSETASTRRSRKFREKKALHCNADATKCNGEIEKDIEKEINIYSPVSDETRTALSANIIDIVSYLNLKAGTKYKHSAQKTRKHIKARLNDGFSLEDFKKVIDKKVDEWLNTDMSKYLRPETLFGTKFESYLNQPEPEKSEYDDLF